MVVEVWGPTGYGGHGNATIPSQGGGGGSGGYSRSIYTVAGSAGLTMNWSCGTGGQALNFANSYVTSGTYSLTAMQVPTGGSGGIGTIGGGGAGGTAGPVGHGGNQSNLGGNAGDAGDPAGIGTGGAAVGGIHATGEPGAAGSYSTTVNNGGLPGTVAFYYT